MGKNGNGDSPAITCPCGAVWPGGPDGFWWRQRRGDTNVLDLYHYHGANDWVFVTVLMEAIKHAETNPA